MERAPGGLSRQSFAAHWPGTSDPEVVYNTASEVYNASSNCELGTSVNFAFGESAPRPGSELLQYITTHSRLLVLM